MNDLMKFNKPQISQDWDYDESVKKVKRIIYKWKNITHEILTELWIAREILSSQGKRTDLDANAPKLTWANYCQDIGIDKSTANRWLHAFQIGSDKVLLSKELEWWTPKKYIDCIYEVMDEIDLDPASCKEANKNIKAKKYYSKEDNGLSYEWFGKVFLNPPYGDEGPPFIEKFIYEYKKGNITEGIILINSRATDANWFQPLFNGLICFTNHRIDFDSPNEKLTSSTHGSCFIYFGPNKNTFAEVFSQFGTVLERFDGQY